MKKVVLTESQAKKLMGKVVSEQAMGNRYRQDVKFTVYHHGTTLAGNEIDWIDDISAPISFDIDMEARSFGIKGISILGVRGPEEVNMNVVYFPEGDMDNSQEQEITMNINWENIQLEDDEDLGWIGISPEGEIELTNDEEGNLIPTAIRIYKKDL